MSTEAASLARSEAGAGARAMLPWLAGIVPYGLVVGVTVATSDIPHLAGWATGPLVYGASAQIATIELLDRGAAPLLIVGTALVIHARLLLYGGAMAGHWTGTSWRWRALAAYLLIDPSFAVGSEGYDHRGPGGHSYYLGAAATLWVAWQAAITAGLVLGSRLPPALQLDRVVPLYLVAQLVARVADRPSLAAALTAAAVSVAAGSLPFHAGLAVAIVAGVAAGAATS